MMNNDNSFLIKCYVILQSIILNYGSDTSLYKKSNKKSYKYNSTILKGVREIILTNHYKQYNLLRPETENNHVTLSHLSLSL